MLIVNKCLALKLQQPIAIKFRVREIHKIDLGIKLNFSQRHKMGLHNS